MADGFKRYFNSTTLSGRANVAKATYASFALLYIVYRLRKSPKKPTEPPPLPPPPPSTTTPPPPPSTTTPPPPPPPSTTTPPPPPPSTPPENECIPCRERRPFNDQAAAEEHKRHTTAKESEGCSMSLPPPPIRRRCPCEGGSSPGSTSTVHHPAAVRVSCCPTCDPEVTSMQQTVTRFLRDTIGAVVMKNDNSSNTNSNHNNGNNKSLQRGATGNKHDVYLDDMSFDES